MACLRATSSCITGPRKLPKRSAGRRASSATSKFGFSSARTTGAVVRCPYWVLKSAKGLLGSAPLLTIQFKKRSTTQARSASLRNGHTRIRSLSPVTYGFRRHGLILRLLGDETLESLEDPKVTLGFLGSAQKQFPDVILWCCLHRRGCRFHGFTSVGISKATARRSSVASFR